MHHPRSIPALAGLCILSLGGAPASAAPADNGGIELPQGFEATVFADQLGQARHMAVTGDGDVYVALDEPNDGGGIVALRDTNGDGRAERIEHFGERGGSGLALHGGAVYQGTVTTILRYPLDGALVPQQAPQTVVAGMPDQGQHSARSITINDDGELFMNSGAPSNSCQRQDRTPRSKGQDPCPLLERHGGIWRFDANGSEQQYRPGQRYATGIRNAVAIDWNARADSLYILQHGRDQLHQNWPDTFTQKQGANLPAEEFFAVEAGDDFGWPYCYYDPKRNKKVLAPEYGGDGSKVGRCEQFEDPILAFPAHWAPNGLLFYYGGSFPERYSGGAFIAFHGSWNRAPLEQEGYKVVFVPFENGRPAGDDWRVFADGFAGKENLRSPGNAEYRPVGLAQGPDGALYISDDAKGRIWRVTYTGE